MNISPELIAIAILGVSLVSLGWKVFCIPETCAGSLLQIHLVREDVADLRERMARLEGLFEGFTRRRID